ncbi:MAG: hypothetical protein ACWA47_06895 [Brevirhabdus sp.]
MRFHMGFGIIGQARAGYDFEAGWTPDLVMPPGSSVSGGAFARDTPGVIAMDLTGLDGSAGGIVFKIGGTVLGAYVGFRSDGSFIARCGDGAVPWAQGTAHVVIQPGRIAGDGTLAVGFMPGDPSGVSVMWNGGLVGQGILGAALPDWTGANQADYLLTSANIPQGEIGGSVTGYTSASALRYYAGRAL